MLYYTVQDVVLQNMVGGGPSSRDPGEAGLEVLGQG